jgi:hypothetical protein
MFPILISDQTCILKKCGIEAAVLTTAIRSFERCTETEDNASESESDKEELKRNQKLNPCAY